jgi:4-hydroxymandelate oxidase
MTLPPTLPAYERAARDVLPPDVAAYLFGGAGSEDTLHANRAALDEMPLVPRLCRAKQPIGVELFGYAYAAPILVAPMGYQRLFHHDGESATARAAAALGLGYVLPTLSNIPMEEIVATMEGAPHWFQLYIQPDRESTLALLRRAERCGARAIVITLDAPVDGVRDRQIEAGFCLPAHLKPVHLDGLAATRGTTPVPEGWAALAWLCQQTPLPVIAKGIMHPEDAAIAVDCGCRGLIVSNHGGRVLDGAIGAFQALPAVVARVGAMVPVLFDSGIRRGTDILKALQTGAKAVFVGRPVLCGLTVAGDRGAAHVLKMMMEEYELALGLA